MKTEQILSCALTIICFLNVNCTRLRNGDVFDASAAEFSIHNTDANVTTNTDANVTTNTDANVTTNTDANVTTNTDGNLTKTDASNPRKDSKAGQLDIRRIDAKPSVLGSCVAYSGGCWTLGKLGENCDVACNRLLRAYDPATMSSAGANTLTNCRNIYTAVVGSAPGGFSSNTGAFGFCGKLNNTAETLTTSSFSGENRITNQEPFCACTNNSIATAGNFSAVAAGNNYNLSWTTTTGQGGFLIVRGTTTSSFSPTDGLTYSLGAQGSETIIYAGFGSAYTDNAQPALVVYSIWAYDANHKYSPKVEAIGARCPGGTIAKKLCWHHGAAGATCDATCGAAGGTFAPSLISSVISDTNSCLVLKEFISGGNGANVSASTANKLCGRNASTNAAAWYYSGTWSGTTSVANVAPYCTCEGF